MIVVAITLILAAMSVVGVVYYRRTLKQAEYDGIAKEIFVAAQNHLSSAESAGLLSSSSLVKGTKEDGDEQVYWFLVNNTGAVGNISADPDDQSSTLGHMLPFAAVDETVRKGGNYIVRYQFSYPAKILDVFYSAEHAYSVSDYEALLDLRTERNKYDRRHYGQENHVVGYYGGVDTDVVATKEALNAPLIEVTNAEKLTVLVKDTNSESTTEGLELKLIIEGMQSGAKKQVVLVRDGFDPETSYGFVTASATRSVKKIYFTVTLDDITEKGMHFADICDHDDTDSSKKFIPGENVRLYAVAYSTSEFAQEGRTEYKYTNSLFSALEGDIALISNARHLENLGVNVSGFDGDADSRLVVTKARQTTDISVPAFHSLTSGKIYDSTGTSHGDNRFIPINPAYSIKYSGNGKAISGAVISESGEAGLFSSVNGTSADRAIVSNLELIDFNVASSSGSSGGAAGKMKYTDVLGVLVHNDSTKDDSALVISGAASSGGIVGTAENVSFDHSAASVYVSSTGNSGGLAGSVSASNISHSYSGGHTVKGIYLDTDSGAGHVNVTGVSAGGLVGNLVNTTVSYSYSTCSAGGSGTAGGFAGTASSSTISSSYATGLISGTGTSGAFIGNAATLSSSNNKYFSIINEGLAAVGNGTFSEIAPFDDRVTEPGHDEGTVDYNGFLTTGVKAFAYDSWLIFEFAGGTHMPDIMTLDTSVDASSWPAYMKGYHYGDWPTPETKIINPNELISASTPSPAPGMNGNVGYVRLSYGSDALIPGGSTLSVSGVDTSGAAYARLKKQAEELLGTSMSSRSFADFIDISILNGGKAIQPGAAVTVDIQLGRLASGDDGIIVIHFGDVPEIIESKVVNNVLTFKTNGFSAYAIVGHEGGEIITPRVEFHFIDSHFMEFVEDGGSSFYYSANPYSFLNKAGTWQTSQIVRDGEKLELMVNPPNKPATATENPKYFFGWYTVNKLAVNSSGNVTYSWSEDPDSIAFETSVVIDPSKIVWANDAHTAITSLVWKIGDKEFTANTDIDSTGCAHIYVAPIYEDYYFVNYHLGAKDSEIWGTLMNRRLIVLGSDGKVSVNIGVTKAPSTDATRQVFAGWETVNHTTAQKTKNGLPVWLVDGVEIEAAMCPDGGEAVMIDIPTSSKTIFQSVDPVTGLERTATVRASDGSDYPTPEPSGYYIVIRESDCVDRSVDLYPVFAQARWILYNIGKSGNGATYVPSEFVLTSNMSQGSGYESPYFVEKVPSGSLPTRNGYNFMGWYADAAINPATGEITNLTEAKDVTVLYTDEHGNAASYTESLIARKLTDETGRFTTGDYQRIADGKLIYEIKDGRLYVYEELENLTLYALWTPKTVNYTVVYWLENADDDDYTLMFYKTMEGVAGNMTNVGWVGQSDTAENPSTGATFNPYDKFKLKFCHPAADQDKEKAGDQTGIQQQVIEGDESTIINVYYDRNVYKLRFDIGFARRTSTAGTTSIWSTISAENAQTYTGTVYGIVDGSTVALTPDGNGGWTYQGTEAVRHDYTGYRYKTTTGTDGTQYGVAGGNVVELTIDSATVSEYYLSQYNTAGSAEYNGTVYNANSGVVTNPVYPNTYYRRTRARNQLYWLERTTTTTTITYNGGTAYGSGTRYLRVGNNDADTSYNLGFVDGAMRTVSRDAQGWYYETSVAAVKPYTGDLYIETAISGTWQFSVSNTTGPNYQANNNWDTFLTGQRLDLGTSCPFDASEYTGIYNVAEGGTPYMVFYYDLTAKYGETIFERYPGSQPTRRNGTNAYPFVGWLAQRDSYYNASMNTSIKGYFETLTETLILTGGTIPGYNTKVNNVNEDDYVAITVNENNTVTGEHGITQEFRCRYNTGSGKNYLYRIYLADNETAEYPAEPSYKFVVTAGSGSNPEQQTPPTFYGYTLMDSKVLNSAGTEQTPGTSYGAYAIPELTAAGVDSGMIMVFRFKPNQHNLTFKYADNTELGSASYYFGKSLADADAYTAMAVANTPVGYSFAGWFENNDGVGKAFNFNTTMPDGDIVLYAVYKPLKYRVRIDPNGGEIDHINHNYDNASADITKRGYQAYWWNENGDAVAYDPALYNSSWTPFATFNRDTDSGYRSDQSTYFNGTYNETVGEYDMDGMRRYVEITEVEAENLGTGNWFYYLNTQYRPTDGSSLPSDLRNALYITEAQVDEYYNFYRDWVQGNLDGGYITGTVLLGKQQWMDAYLAKDAGGSFQKYRRLYATETYTFLGWYKVLYDNEGNEIGPDSMPYNFSDPVTGPLTIRAYWRLDGGYRIVYTPYFTMNDGTVINGTMDAWTDPQTFTTSYADGAKTNIYRQPNEITAGGSLIEGENYIFRGWRLVSVRMVGGEEIYTPLENNVFYDPGAPFTIRAAYADENSLIRFQAYYERKNESYRRPEIANLILDANSGFITTNGTNPISSNTPLTWNGVGTLLLDSTAKQMLFGNIQSNVAVHLYQYATELTQNAAGAALDPVGKQYFKHNEGYLLLGFDEASNENDFIATYPADSVISVGRKDNITLYAVWEPMVYLNIVNDTENADVAGGPITISLSSTAGDTLYVVNKKTGMFDRALINDFGSITVEKGETLGLVVPYGEGHDITVSGTNTLGTGIFLYWQGELNGVTAGHPFGEAKNGEAFSVTDNLVVDPTGITVVFRTLKSDYTLVLDENWSGGHTAEVYFSSNPADSNYVVSPYTLPSTSTRLGYEFIGWADTKAKADAGEPDYPTTNLDISDMKTAVFDVLDTDDDQTVTLYAVWKAKADASTIYVYKNVPSPGDPDKEFTFNMIGTVGALGSPTTYSISEVYTLKNNQYLKIYTPFDGGTVGGNSTQTIIVEKYTVGTNGAADVLVTTYPQIIKTWDNPYYSSGFPDNFSLRVTESDYTMSPHFYDTDVEVAAYTQANPITKANIREISWATPHAGGTVIFTNTRQTADVRVRKILVGPSVVGLFTYTASYTVDGETTDLGTFTVTSTGEGTLLEDIPVGADVTVTEAFDNSYIISAASSDVTDSDPAANVFRFVLPYRTESQGPVVVTYTNVLKSYPVKIVKVGYDGITTNTEVEAEFALTGELSNIFSGRLTTPSNNVVFETGKVVSGSAADPEIYVGEYTLSETRVWGKYLAIGSAAVLVVDGDGVHLKTPVEGVAISKVGDVYVVTLTNRRTVDITVTAAISDPIVAQRDFYFSGSYKLNGNTFLISEFSITARRALPGTYTLTIPVGATELMITEDVERAADGVSKIKDMYNTTVAYNTNSPVTASSYTYSTSITALNEDDVITFTNTRKTVNVTVKKVNEVEGDTNTFTFTVTLLNGSLPIQGYTLATDPLTTDSLGRITFNLAKNGTKILSVPIGAALRIVESGVNSGGTKTLDDYSTTASAQPSYAGGSYNEEERTYTLSPVPSSAITVTFTNSDGVMEVIFPKIDGDGEPLPGAQFTVYDTYEHAYSGGLTGIIKVTVGTSKYDHAVSDASGIVSFKINSGVYYLKETQVPGTAGYYKFNDNVYRLVVGKNGATAAGITLPAGADFVLRRMSDSMNVDDAVDIAAKGILNERSKMRKVILKKISEAYVPLQNAKFTIYGADMTVLYSGLTSSENGVFFIGALPCGTYYLKETSAPFGYNLPDEGKYFKIKVSDSGTEFIGLENHF